MTHLLTERIIASAVGNGLLFQRESLWGGYRIHCWWVQLSGDQVEDHLAANSFIRYCLAACPFNDFHAMCTGSDKDGNKLFITTEARQESPLDLLQARREFPALKGCTVTQSSRLALEDANI